MNLPDESWRIDTPENVAFDYEVAGIGSRFLAALLDTLLVFILQVITVLTALLLVTSLSGDRSSSSLGGWLLAIFGLIAFLFQWGYFVLFEMIWNGQSPGKRSVGLRVIRTDGTPITLGESLIRNLVRLVDSLPIAYGVGLVAMFISPQARRLGDLAAGTLVVRDRPSVTLESLAARPVAGPFEPPLDAGTDLAVERLSSQDVQMAEDFLRRRSGFSNDLQLAQRIALALLKKMGVAESRLSGVSATDLIQVVVQAWRERGQQQS